MILFRGLRDANPYSEDSVGATQAWKAALAHVGLNLYVPRLSTSSQKKHVHQTVMRIAYVDLGTSQIPRSIVILPPGPLGTMHTHGHTYGCRHICICPSACEGRKLPNQSLGVVEICKNNSAQADDCNWRGELRACVCVHIHTYIHTYTHTHSYTFSDIYIYICIYNTATFVGHCSEQWGGLDAGMEGPRTLLRRGHFLWRLLSRAGGNIGPANLTLHSLA